MERFLFGILMVSLWLNAGVVDTIKKEHKIRIGIKYDTKPFGFKEGKKIKGFDLELSKLIVKKIKEHYKLSELKTFYKKVLPSNREEMLMNKKVDMIIATYSITDERKKKVDFSIPYLKSKSILLYRNNFENNTTVGMLDGANVSIELQKRGYKFKKYNDYKTLFEAFDSNVVNAIASDRAILLPYLNKKEYVVLVLQEDDSYAIGLPKGDEEFKYRVDEILKKLNASKKIEALYQKWFQNGVQ